MEFRSVELRQLLNESIVAPRGRETLIHAAGRVAGLRGKEASVIEWGNEEKKEKQRVEEMQEEGSGRDRESWNAIEHIHAGDEVERT